MSIQGMSQGLSFSNMSYYISERIPGIIPCTTPPLYAQSNAGSYNTTFDMGTASGCAIIVAEVGITRTTQTTSAPADQPIGDKTRWEYKRTYGSEYSACQMGNPLTSAVNNQYRPPTNLYEMVGMGYMRGFIGAPYKDSGGNLINTNTPVSVDVGTKLTGTSVPTTADVTNGSGMANGARYLAFDNGNNLSFGNPPTGKTAPLLAHGMFSGNNIYTGGAVYNYNNVSGNYVLSGTESDFAGPYTGHLETEINDPNVNKAYPGSSAVTLNKDLFSTRQAMMVVPIANGGMVNVRSEQFVEGTWASIKIFCPITLPKWGLANNMMGVQEVYQNADLDNALLMNGGTSIVNGATTSSTSVTLTVAQINSGGDAPTVGQLVTGTGIPQGTVVSAVSGTTLTLSQNASIANGVTITYSIHPLRKIYQNYANQSNVSLNPDPNDPTVTQADRYNFFGSLGGVVKFNPYPTAAAALSHNFGAPGNTTNFPKAKNKTAYHVPSQNSIYRSQGYGDWKAPGGGSPVSNHGSHVLHNHASAALKFNTLASGGTVSNSEAFHGIPNVHDWVFSRSNGARRSRLPARGILDRTRHANNQSSTVGGWYAMRITGYFDAGNPTVSSTKIYAVQVGSLDHTRGDADIDVDSVANQVPRDGVIRTIIAA